MAKGLDRAYFLEQEISASPLGRLPTGIRLGTEMRRKEGPRQWEFEGEAANTLYNKYLAGKPFDQAVTDYLQVCLGLNNIHASSANQENMRARGVLNNTIVNIAEQLAIDHAPTVDQENLYALQQKVQFAQAPGEQDEKEVQRILSLRRTSLNSPYPFGQDQWFVPKLINLIARTEAWKKTYSWLEELKQSPQLERFLESITIEELQEGIKIMRENLFSPTSIGHGVASGVFRSPLFLPKQKHEKQRGFAVHDASIGLGNIGENKESLINIPFDDIFAVVEAITMPKPTDSLQKSIKEHTARYADYVEIQVASSTTNPFAVMRIDKKGNFYSFFMGQQSFEDIFRKYGVEKQGLALELFLLMRLSDLTMKTRRVDDVPSLLEFEEALTGESSQKHFPFFSRRLHPSTSYNMDYRRLFVPRTSPNNPQLGEEPVEEIHIEPSIQAEVSEEELALSPEENEIVYEKRLMPVTATLRKLPDGYQASIKAQELAQNYFGIEKLPEGWTFVSSGKREMLVRINAKTGQPFVRKIIFQDKETPTERLLRMINEIKSGQKPRR